MSKRQEYWLKQGITKQGIENHLYWERKKAKESRDRKKKNNEKNKELIKQIKNDLLEKEFEVGDRKFKVLSVNPSVDGIGFWWKCLITFNDGSNGEFRYFYDFNGYNLKKFKKWLKYI
jgi:hypothetical protein